MDAIVSHYIKYEGHGKQYIFTSFIKVVPYTKGALHSEKHHKINHKSRRRDMFVSGSPGDGLEGRSNSNWQTGRGESPTPPSSDNRPTPSEEVDTSHLADVHVAGSSPCPSDMSAFKDVQTMGK